MARLRSSRFIRSSGSSERIETYHDRIREVLAAQIAPDAVRRIHGLMVQTLVERRSDDCEALFEHYRGAGDAENASIQAGLAAGKAGAALAFDRAAFFYRQALALAPAVIRRAGVGEGLANALANAGRPAEAADAYLRAAAGASHPQRVELQRRGAEQFLIGGDIDRGLDLIRTMLAGLGMGMPRSPRSALLWLLWRRARLRWRGLGFVPRPVERHRRRGTPSRRHLLVGDDGTVAGRHDQRLGFQRASPAHGARCRRTVPYRPRDGDRVGCQGRVSDRQSVDRATRSSSQRRWRRASETRTRSRCPSWRTASYAMTVGEWKKALTLVRAGAGNPARPVRGVHVGIEHRPESRDWALMYQGELGELSRQVPALLANARSSGNLYIATELCTRSNFVWLAADDPDEGERETVESIARWSQKGFHRQHYSARLARVQTALYRGDAEAAWRLFAEQEIDASAFVADAGPRSFGSSRSICERAARWRWPPATWSSPPIPVRGARGSPAHRQRADAHGRIRLPRC